MISVVVRASVSYAAIAAQALAAFESRPHTIDAGLVRGKVHVSDVIVRPLGAQLTVAITFQADMKWPLPRVRGIVNLSATPVYDADTQRLRLSDVAITGDVDHVLARAALASKRRGIVDALNDVLFDFEPVLRDLRDRLNAGLSGSGIAPKVALQGRVETMHVDDIILAEELIVVASASGQLRVIMDPRVGSKSG